MILAKPLFSIPEQISRQIKESILQGELQLGDKLPGENKLSEMFGVSRSTIRDALHLLRTEHIIETRQGNQGGHFVSQKASYLMIQNLNNYAFSSLKFDYISLDQFFEFTLLVEVPIAHFAAIHRSPEDLADLKSHHFRLANLCLLARSSYSIPQAVISFHRSIARTSHNPLIIETIDHLYRLSVVLSFQLLLSFNQRQLLFESIDPIYRSIKKQDALMAERGMSEHLQFLSDITRTKEQDIVFGDPSQMPPSI